MHGFFFWEGGGGGKFRDSHLSIFLPFLCLQLNAASLFHLFTHVHHIHARYNSLPLLTSGTFPEKTGAQYASQPLCQKKTKKKRLDTRTLDIRGAMFSLSILSSLIDGGCKSLTLLNLRGQIHQYDSVPHMHGNSAAMCSFCLNA